MRNTNKRKHMTQKHRKRLRKIMIHAGKLHKHSTKTWSQALKSAWSWDKLPPEHLLKYPAKTIDELVAESNQWKEPKPDTRKKIMILKPVDLSALPTGRIKSPGVYNRTIVEDGHILDRSKLIQSGSFKFENQRYSRFSKIDRDSRSLKSTDYMGIRY